MEYGGQGSNTSGENPLRERGFFANAYTHKKTHGKNHRARYYDKNVCFKYGNTQRRL